MRNALQRYAEGEWRAASDTVTASRTVRIGDVHRTLVREAPAWIAAGPDADRRRLVVASFALEVARTAEVPGFIENSLRDAQFHSSNRNEAVRLIEWACGLVRARSYADEAGRAWWLASVHALSHPGLLYESVAPGFAHVVHARESRPEEPTFALMQAIRDAGQAYVLIRLLDTRDVPVVRRPVRAGVEHRAWLDVMATRQRLQPLENIAAIHSEVQLQLGVAAFALGERDAARTHFARATSVTANPALGYVAHYLTGRIEETDGNYGAAVASYRSALTLVPGAQLAGARLSLLLAARGDYTTAAQAAQRSLEVPDVRDPWLLWGWGDHVGAFRYWASLVTRLRCELRPHAACADLR